MYQIRYQGCTGWVTRTFETREEAEEWSDGEFEVEEIELPKPARELVEEIVEEDALVPAR